MNRKTLQNIEIVFLQHNAKGKEGRRIILKKI